MTANSTQVGGIHYRSKYQHWDLVATLSLGYFEGQITKYVTRHRAKHGAQDLDKAEHYAVKMKELNAKALYPPRHTTFASQVSFHVNHFCNANRLDSMEDIIISDVCVWLHNSDIDQIIASIKGLRSKCYSTKTTPSAGICDAGPGYVDQDR